MNPMYWFEKSGKGSKEIQRYTFLVWSVGIHQRWTEPYMSPLKTMHQMIKCLWLSVFFSSNSQVHQGTLKPPIQFWDLQSKKITLTSVASSKHSTFGEKLHPNFDHVNQASKSYARCVLKPKRLYRTTANWIRFLGWIETNTSMQMLPEKKQKLTG